MRRRRNPYARADSRTRSARREGYPARSVHKLEEMDRRVGLLARGRRVLDLGAAPGSWTLYAARRVGAAGLVVAVDVVEVRLDLPDNVRVVRKDVHELVADDRSLGIFGGFDAVLSDMAPKTTGDRVSDGAKSFELFSTALRVASRVLRTDGSFVGKLFMSGDFAPAKQAVVERFARCRVVRPRGSRQRSTEVYLVGTGHLGGAPGR